MEDKFASLRAKLEQESTFPLKYMYKFIVTKEKVQEILPFFETAEISTKKSSSGKYTSISAVVIAFSADEIIDRYKSISHLEGVISL